MEKELNAKELDELFSEQLKREIQIGFPRRLSKKQQVTQELDY